MKRSLFLAGALTLISSMVFAGGGGQQQGTRGASAQPSNRTITINTQAGVGGEAAWKAVAEGYKKHHPEVNVVIDLKPAEGYGEWIQTMFSTANPGSDIVNINLAGPAAVGKEINWLEYADQKSPYSNGKWRDQFNFQMQNVDLARQVMNAVSLESVQVLWLYNKDIFAKVGVQPPKTWNELVQVCEKLYAAGYQPISIPGDFNSFWAMQMGWLARIYPDQTTRSQVNLVRAQPGDYLYDPDVDGVWKFDPTDPYNDDSWKVNQNPVRFWKALADGRIDPASQGYRTVWQNFAKIFPKYAGGDAFFGTSDANPLFYQGKAAMVVDGAWGILGFKTNMDKLASGQEIKSGEEVITGVQKFNLGTFNMPSMEGPGIEAPARTIEVANGFLGAVKKDKAHNDLVADFLMYYSSKEGYSLAMTAALGAGGSVSGPPLVYGVELPADIQPMFANLSFIGNTDKGCGNWVARGIGDVQEALRLFYDYSQSYLTGKTTIDQWLASHKAQNLRYMDQAMAANKISRNDLNNPQNAPTGQ